MKINVLIVVLVLSVISLYYYKRPDIISPSIVTHSSYGIVKRVSDCHVGKHSYRCRVETDLSVYYEMDVSDFPNEFVEIGDHLFIERINDGREINSSLCKNDKCTLNGVCYWWMPCFNLNQP